MPRKLFKLMALLRAFSLWFGGSYVATHGILAHGQTLSRQNDLINLNISGKRGFAHIVLSRYKNATV